MTLVDWGGVIFKAVYDDSGKGVHEINVQENKCIDKNMSFIYYQCTLRPSFFLQFKICVFFIQFRFPVFFLQEKKFRTIAKADDGFLSSSTKIFNQSSFWFYVRFNFRVVYPCGLQVNTVNDLLEFLVAFRVITQAGAVYFPRFFLLEFSPSFYCIYLSLYRLGFFMKIR